MKEYVILRRRGWRSYTDLAAALERADRVARDQIPGDVRWIRSYLLDEDRGEAGTFCIYRAFSPEAIRRHAARAGLPVDEIIAVAGTLISSHDPQNPGGWLPGGVAQATQPTKEE
ncbi:MAG: DUF4242 domain-containing protein [Solirubrobacterales bacterium]|nr:DUF4242 domain-containing protein [Solirubrobacterales bacterium]